MSGNMSKALQLADEAFAKTQSQVLGRTRASQDHDDENADRAEKTKRLRLARLERESCEAVAGRTALQKPG